MCELPPLVDDARQRVEPGVVGQDLHRHDRRTLGREAHAPHVRDGEERLADLLDVLRAELVGVAAADDDVLELGARRDVLVGAPPALVVRAAGGPSRPRRCRGRWRTSACRSGSRPGTCRAAERAPCRGSGASGRARARRPARASESSPSFGWSGRRRDAEREELGAQRVVVRVLPVDERDDVRADAHAHRRALHARSRGPR